MKQYQAQTTNVDVSKLTDTRQSLEKRRSKFKEMFAADIITMDELKKKCLPLMRVCEVLTRN